MSRIPFKPASYNEAAFNCPFCHAYANQTWGDLIANLGNYGNHQIPSARTFRCAHCGRFGFWLDTKLAFPLESSAPLPNPDLPSEVVEDFNEARDILNRSPRGAAALLRLAVQKLCAHLGEPGKNINDDIAALVKKRLPVRVQQALDTVRVIGNNAVHPGQMDLKDDVVTATNLFQLVNIIAESQITQHKQIEELFGKLPEGQREAIKKRDG